MWLQLLVILHLLRTGLRLHTANDALAHGQAKQRGGPSLKTTLALQSAHITHQVIIVKLKALPVTLLATKK